MADDNGIEKQGVEAEFMGKLAEEFTKLLADDEAISDNLSAELVACAQNQELSADDLIKVFEANIQAGADHD